MPMSLPVKNGVRIRTPSAQPVDPALNGATVTTAVILSSTVAPAFALLFLIPICVMCYVRYHRRKAAVQRATLGPDAMPPTCITAPKEPRIDTDGSDDKSGVPHLIHWL